MTLHSPIAADAITRQIVAQADTTETFYADIAGIEREFTASFAVNWNGPFQDETGPEYDEAECSLVGAVAYDDETDTLLFLGSRDELIAVIGQREVWRWEMEQSERMTEEGQ